jgi:outer membrane protein assembly factor BamB
MTVWRRGKWIGKTVVMMRLAGNSASFLGGVAKSLLPFSACLLFAALANAEDWPGFRGPSGNGHNFSELPLEWDGASGKNILWKSPLPATTRGGKPDHNQSSPIVSMSGRVIVTTAFWSEKQTGSDIPEQHVTCYDARDGKELWDVPVPAGPWKLSDLRGGYCAPTPVTDGQRVYVVFGSSVMAAIDLDGKLVWRKEIPDWQSFDVAIASSPILHGGKLVVLADRNGQKSTLTAYDPKTGDVVWEKKRPECSFNHTTPVIVDSGGMIQMLVAASSELQALDPDTGEKLWWCKTPGDVTSPVFAKGVVFTDSGRGGPGILVDASGKGDVTATHVKWKVDQIPEGLSSPAIVGDYLYRLHNPGVLKCFALADGKEAYAKRLDGVSVSSSPITTPSGRLYFASAGKTFVVQGGPTFKLLATNDLGEPSSSSAAAANGRLYLKGQKHLFCVGEK